MTKNRALIIPAVIVGVILIVVAIVYFAEPAKSLPSFFPGHAAAVTRHHVKHGIAAAALAVVALAIAWMSSGTRTEARS